MTTWNSAGYPPSDPNQGYYGGQPGGYPPQQPYPGGYPGAPPSGYPGAPPPSGYPGAPPPSGYPQPYGPAAPGFVPHAPGPGMGYGGGYDQPNQPDMYGTPYGGGEDGDVKGFDFSDQSIRRGFIRKVYSILMVQLSLTVGVIALFLYHTPTRRFVQNHGELFIIALVIVFASMIAIACCGEVRRKSPINFILLGLFTTAEAFLLGVTASRFQSEEVIMAVGITAAVCLALTLFAFQTKWDFTMCGGMLFVAVIVLLVFGIVAIFVHNRIVTLVYASIGALLFSMYLVYDTQLMLGGKHKYSISPEEYIFAALNLYVDIINIFLYILTIIGASRN